LTFAGQVSPGGSDAAAGSLLDVLASVLAGSHALEVKRDNLIRHSFTPGGLAENQHHEVGFALAAARETGLATLSGQAPG
jgi:2-hydroxy-3-oxopropionate reductase